MIEALLLLVGLYLGMVGGHAISTYAMKKWGAFGAPTTFQGWLLTPYYLVKQLVVLARAE